MADNLRFEVPMDWIPASMYEKAARLLEGGTSTILKRKPAGYHQFVYYVLSQSQARYDKLTDTLVQKCAATRYRTNMHQI